MAYVKLFHYELFQVHTKKLWADLVNNHLCFTQLKKCSITNTISSCWTPSQFCAFSSVSLSLPSDDLYPQNAFFIPCTLTFFLSLFLIFSNLHTQPRARTHDPRIKSYRLHWLNKPGAPPCIFLYFSLCMNELLSTCSIVLHVLKLWVEFCCTYHFMI